MRSQERWIEPRLAAIVLGVVIIILYGSLFPFQFHNNSSPLGPFGTLIASWRILGSRRDLLANVLLYVPFGLFSIRALRRPAPWARVILVTLAGLALSVSIELAQFYDAGRDTGMSDVYANTLGAFAGATAGAIFRRNLHLPLVGRMEWRPFVVLLLACWLGSELYPYLPAFDSHKYWDALSPLVIAPKLPLLNLYIQTVSWLAVAVLLEAVFGVARSRLALMLLIPAVLIARILIAEITLSPAEIIGSILGGLLWSALLSRLRMRAAVVAGCFVSIVVIRALEPFTFSSVSRPFGWIPFLSVLETPREASIRIFLEKVFTYGAMIWLLVRAGWRLSIATLFGGALVFALRLTQMYLPGRSAEITDAIMLLIVAAIMKLLGEGGKQLES